VGVIPTDTMYALVCNIDNATAVDALYRCVPFAFHAKWSIFRPQVAHAGLVSRSIKDMNRKKPLSILCRDFSDVDLYTRGTRWHSVGLVLPPIVFLSLNGDDVGDGAGFPMTGSTGNASPFRLAKQCLPGAVS
jgi:tRNA A37 threonylcarbamoyladenosine synthetase subunit TsaC/SUA5/YrdC